MVRRKSTRLALQEAPQARKEVIGKLTITILVSAARLDLRLCIGLGDDALRQDRTARGQLRLRKMHPAERGQGVAMQ